MRKNPVLAGRGVTTPDTEQSPSENHPTSDVRLASTGGRWSA